MIRSYCNNITLTSNHEMQRKSLRFFIFVNQEKILFSYKYNRTKTAAGECVEHTKAFGIIILKELGKLVL